MITIIVIMVMIMIMMIMIISIINRSAMNTSIYTKKWDDVVLCNSWPQNDFVVIT